MKELTKEQVMSEVSRLRAEYESIRRKTKELGLATTRLYLRLDQLTPDASKTTLKT